MNDSHMVASGVPDKNGDRHASIIASMALDVMVSFGLNVKVSTDDKKTINARRPFKNQVQFCMIYSLIKTHSRQKRIRKRP